MDILIAVLIVAVLVILVLYLRAIRAKRAELDRVFNPRRPGRGADSRPPTDAL